MTNSIKIKVTPTSRGNFSKLKRYKEEEIKKLQPGGEVLSPYEAVHYDPKQQLNTFEIPTYPLFNAAKFANGLITNQKNFDLARLKKVPLELATVQYDKVTGDYTYQTALQQKIADNYSRAAQLASGTSNGDLASAIQLQALKQNDDIALQGALSLDQSYKLSVAKHQAVAASNNQEATRVGNNNLKNLIGLDNILLNDKMSFNNTKGELYDQFMTSMRTDSTLYNRMRVLNEQQKWLNLNKPIYDENIAKIQAAYRDSQDKSKYSGWQDLYNFANTAANQNLAGVKEYLDWATKNQDKYGGNATSFEAFKDYAEGDGTKNHALFKDFDTNWSNYKKEQEELYLKRMREELNKWNRASLWPVQISGEMPWYSWSRSNLMYTLPYRSVEIKKEGGTISGKDRFLEYLEHNRKSEKDLHDRVSEYSKRSQELLKRDLDALDRETLLLLRSIFK